MCAAAHAARLDLIRKGLTLCDCGGTLRVTFDPPVMVCLACGIRWEMPHTTHYAMTRAKIAELRRALFPGCLPEECRMNWDLEYDFFSVVRYP